MKIDLNVNGKAVSVDVPPQMPLLWVLRDVLNLTGTKYGCGEGQCGACTVHLRGRAVRSCQVEVSAAANAPVVTIEGLSTNASHPLQQAWIETRRAAVRLLPGRPDHDRGRAAGAKTPAPTDADIDNAMGGNICRCGTYRSDSSGDSPGGGRARGRTSAGQMEAGGVDDHGQHNYNARPSIVSSRQRPRGRRDARRAYVDLSGLAQGRRARRRRSRRTRSSASPRTASSRSWPRTPRWARASRRCCR